MLPYGTETMSNFLQPNAHACIYSILPKGPDLLADRGLGALIAPGICQQEKAYGSRN